LYFVFRNKTYEEKRKIGVILSIIAIIILILRNIEIYVKNGYVPNEELIPLQICHFANFVLLFAFLKDNKVLFALAFCLNLPAAMMSIIFANGLENYSTLLNFRGMAYLWGHMLIVAMTLWAVASGFVKITKKTLGKTMMLMVFLYVIGLVINNIFNVLFGFHANYFYTLKPENGTPLELFFNWGKMYIIGWFKINPIYMILTSLLGGIIVFGFYGMYKAVEPKIKSLQ
jgi:uncharacterized membrane protein YwaF